MWVIYGDIGGKYEMDIRLFGVATDSKSRDILIGKLNNSEIAKYEWVDLNKLTDISLGWYTE